MSTSPVTLMVARRVAQGRYHEMMAWLHEGEQLATDFPGYLGSGVLAPRPAMTNFRSFSALPMSTPCTPGSIPPLDAPGWCVAAVFSHNPRSIGSAALTAGSAQLISARRAGNRPSRSGWLFPRVADFQLSVGPAAQSSGPVAAHHGQHSGAHPADGLSVHPAVHAPAGALATEHACTGTPDAITVPSLSS